MNGVDDSEVTWNLVGLQVAASRYLLRGLADHGLEICRCHGEKRVPDGTNHRQQVGPNTVAVDEDLSDQRAVAEHRLDFDTAMNSPWESFSTLLQRSR